MDLQLDISGINNYTSKSQIARILTENWVKKNIFCRSCGYEKLNNFNNNLPVADFYCENCKAEYELKSKKRSFTLKIVSGSYRTMIERINSNNNPNFFFLSYCEFDFTIKNFLVIPRHYFIDNIIEKRKPLAGYAKRAGWIGCNILLNNIPESGKIFIVKNGQVIARTKVLKAWSETAFISNQRKDNKGWTIEILKILDKIPNKKIFTQ